MAGKGCPALSMVLVAALVMYPVVVTGTALGAEKVTPKVTVKVGELRGTLLDAMGKAVGKATIEVVGEDGKVVGTAVSGKDGTFTLKKLAAGDYTMKVEKKVPFRIAVTANADLSHLLVIIPPKTKKYSAGGLTATQLKWVICGGVLVATAITLPIALHDDDDDDEVPAPAPTAAKRVRRVSP